MKILFNICLLFLFSTLNSQSSNLTNQNGDPKTGNPIIALGKGVNLPSIQNMNAAHYKIIKNAGFAHVRIPVHPFSQTQGAPGFTLKPSFFELLDTAVNRSLVNGLIPIIDFHEHNAMQKDPLGTKAMFLKIWNQIALHYKNSPPQVLFEIANEPNMKAEIWNEILSEAHTIIRSSNPGRTLLIGTINGNQIKYLKDLKIPRNDKNVIVTIHYYMPIEFTHQGAEWSKNYKEISGLIWPSEKSSEQEILADFKLAEEWSRANGIALHLGEFGTYSKSALDSRARWTNFVARQAENLNWSWCYWELNQGFGIFDLKTNKWNEELFNALFP